MLGIGWVGISVCVSLTVRDAEMRMSLSIIYSSLFVLFFYLLLCNTGGLSVSLYVLESPWQVKINAFFFNLKPLFLLAQNFLD